MAVETGVEVDLIKVAALLWFLLISSWLCCDSASRVRCWAGSPRGSPATPAGQPAAPGGRASVGVGAAQELDSSLPQRSGLDKRGFDCVFC